MADTKRLNLWAKIQQAWQAVLILVAVFAAGSALALKLAGWAALPGRMDAVEQAEKEDRAAIAREVRHDSIQDARIAYLVEHGSPTAVATWKMMLCHMQSLTLKQCNQLQTEPPSAPRGRASDPGGR